VPGPEYVREAAAAAAVARQHLTAASKRCLDEEDVDLTVADASRVRSQLTELLPISSIFVILDFKNVPLGLLQQDQTYILITERQKCLAHLPLFSHLSLQMARPGPPAGHGPLAFTLGARFAAVSYTSEHAGHIRGLILSWASALGR